MVSLSCHIIRSEEAASPSFQRSQSSRGPAATSGHAASPTSPSQRRDLGGADLSACANLVALLVMRLQSLVGPAEVGGTHRSTMTSSLRSHSDSSRFRNGSGSGFREPNVAASRRSADLCRNGRFPPQAAVAVRPKADITTAVSSLLRGRSARAKASYRALDTTGQARLGDRQVLPPMERSKSWPRQSPASTPINPSS